MRLFRLFLATVLLAGFWLTALPAHAAGTLSVSPPIWKNRVGANRNVTLMNRSDCVNDAVVTFSVRVAGVSSSAVLELWVGNACDTQANRLPANKQCVQITNGVTANTALNTTVEARFQDMVKPFGSTEAGTAASCDLEASSGQVTRSLFFVVYNSGTTMSEATTMPWVFKYDVKAPAPPTGVSAGGGENSLVVKLTAPAGESNLLRYHFYCSPLGSSTNGTAGSASTAGTSGTDTGGTSGTDTGGTSGTDTGGASGTDTGGTDGIGMGGVSGTDTGGTDGTGGTTGGTDATSGSGGVSGTSGSSSSGDTSGSSGTSSIPAPAEGCSSDILVAGADAPAKAIDCGTLGAQGATSGETKQVLDNDVTYAVAVATEDNANNIGVLSQIACGTPQDVTGFYEAYRDAGGKAGGGFCSFAPARRGSLISLLALAMAAAVLGWRRR